MLDGINQSCTGSTTIDLRQPPLTDSALLRSHLDSFNKRHRLYYDRKMGWPIDKKFGDRDLQLIKAPADKMERMSETSLQKKELEWEIIPSHQIRETIEGGASLETSRRHSTFVNAGKRRHGQASNDQLGLDDVTPFNVIEPQKSFKKTGKSGLSSEHDSKVSVTFTAPVKTVQVDSATDSGRTKAAATDSASGAASAGKGARSGSEQLEREENAVATEFKSLIGFYERDKAIKTSIAQQRINDRTLEFADHQNLRDLEYKGQRDERQKRFDARKEGKCNTMIANKISPQMASKSSSSLNVIKQNLKSSYCS